MSGTPLPGGHVSRVVRVGDTVRRGPGARAEFVHRLLRYLEYRGWGGAPRFRGVDVAGQEVLSYVEGYVADRDTAWSCTRESLSGVAALVREFHDLTAGTTLAGDREVVCHNDLSPRNTVYDVAGPVARPMAFIDWDLAAPGERIHDVAHMCWQYVGLGPGVADTGQAAERVRVLCDAYGWVQQPLGPVIDTVLWWQERCWRGIEAGAADGDPAMAALCADGVVDSVRAAWCWVAEHRDVLVSGI